MTGKFHVFYHDNNVFCECKSLKFEYHESHLINFKLKALA